MNALAYSGGYPPRMRVTGSSPRHKGHPIVTAELGILYSGMALYRIDFAGKISRPRLLSDGTLRIPARISRTGVQHYSYTDGSQSAEYRDPSEVFDTEALESFRGMAVTVLHPEGGVSPENWSSVTVGHVADDVRADGDYVAASVIVKDAETIKKVLAKELVEISSGYTCKSVQSDGEYKGEKYDALQTEIRGNHVALGPVNWGRAGNEVRVYLDAVQARPIPLAVPPPPSPSDMAYNVGMAKEIKTDAPKTVKEDTVADVGTKADNAPTPSPETVQVVPLAVYERACAERDDARARLDAATKQLSELDSRVDARVALVDLAKGHLPKDFVFSGKSDGDIRRACLTSRDAGLKLDDKSEAYIEARFDLMTESTPDQVRADASRAALATVALAPEVDEPSARERMIADSASMFNNSFGKKG